MEEIEAELKQLFGNGISNDIAPSESPATDDRKKRGMSAAGRARIAAAQRARWAKQKDAASDVVGNGKTPKGMKKRTMSAEARAKIAAAQKKRWAKQKSGK